MIDGMGTLHIKVKEVKMIPTKQIAGENIY